MPEPVRTSPRCCKLRGVLARGRNPLASVILMLPGSPAKTVTLRPAHSASAASSVKSSRPAAAARRCASSRAGKAKALRRLHQAQRVRGRACRSTRAAGVDGLDGVGHRQRGDRRAALRARPRSRGVTSAALAKGRAASCTSTISGVCGASASSPARTELCRVAPPNTGGKKIEAAPPRIETSPHRRGESPAARDRRRDVLRTWPGSAGSWFAADRPELLRHIAARARSRARPPR